MQHLVQVNQWLGEEPAGGAAEAAAYRSRLWFQKEKQHLLFRSQILKLDDDTSPLG